MAGLKFAEAAEYFRHQWVRVFKTIRFCAQDHDGKRLAQELLLEGQVFVHCKEDIEFAGAGNKADKVSVFDACPARPRHGLNFVAWQIPPQTRRQAFVQKNSHLDGLRNGCQHCINGLFKESDGLFAGNGREISKELIQRVSAFEVIQQRPDWNARAGKARSAAHDFRVNSDNGASFHAGN
jgi:hypothetical protein